MLKSPHATSLLITIVSNKLPDTTSLCFHSSVKATCSWRLPRVWSGCQSLLRLRGTWSLRGAAHGRRPPRCRAREPVSPYISGQASPVKQRCTAEVCLLWRATFADQASLPPFTPPITSASPTLIFANSLTHPCVSHVLLGHMPSAWSCTISAHCPPWPGSSNSPLPVESHHYHHHRGILKEVNRINFMERHEVSIAGQDDSCCCKTPSRDPKTKGSAWNHTCSEPRKQAPHAGKPSAPSFFHGHRAEKQAGQLAHEPVFLKNASFQFSL